MGVRRLILAAIGVVAFSLVGPTAASAQTGVATLTGEELDACHAGAAGQATLTCNVEETGPNSFRVRARCTATGGTVSWRAEGIASGPYPGTFTETGTAQFNASGVFTTFQVNFHIDSATAEVDGRKFIEAPMGSGQCLTFGNAALFFTSGGSVRYEAIIKPATGGSFADEGQTSFDLTGLFAEDPRVAESETTIGGMHEAFVSDLAFARPLLPDAKEQCKDEGFLIFGVFENQGDCVSFVSTNGKNEPGQNVAGVP